MYKFSAGTNRGNISSGNSVVSKTFKGEIMKRKPCYWFGPVRPLTAPSPPSQAVSKLGCSGWIRRARASIRLLLPSVRAAYFPSGFGQGIHPSPHPLPRNYAQKSWLVYGHGLSHSPWFHLPVHPPSASNFWVPIFDPQPDIEEHVADIPHSTRAWQ